MQLLTKELRQTILPLYSQENEADPICRAKFFMPDGTFTWYVIEGTNRVIKQIKRAGCGYRNQANYERRIVLHVAAKSAA